MKKFSCFDVYEQLELQNYCNKKMGLALTAQAQHMSYLAVLDRDAQILNRFLEHPASEYQIHQAAFKAQKQYNEAIDGCKKNWKKSDKSIDLGEKIVKDIKANRQMFQKELQSLHDYENKIKNIDRFCLNENSEYEKNSGWVKIEEIVQQWDLKERSKYSLKLEKLKKQWALQSDLARFTIDDLLLYKEQLKNYDALIGYLKINFTPEKNSNDRKISAQLRSNQKIIYTHQKAILQAIKWRLKAAFYAKDIRCDDAYYALCFEIKDLFQHVSKKQQSAIEKVVNCALKPSSYESSLIEFYQMLKNIRRSPLSHEIQGFLKAQTQHYFDKPPLIKLVLFEDVLVPERLMPWIQKNRSWSVGAWLRHCFFKSHAKERGILGLIRKKWIGEYQELAVCLNECYVQLEKFNQNLKEQSPQQDIELNEILKNSGFQNALEIIDMIRFEKNRISKLRPSWITGVLFKWVPFLNRSNTSSFMDCWLDCIDEAQRKIRAQARKSAHRLIANFDEILTQCIKQNSFHMDERIMEKYEEFFRYYADRNDYLKFHNMIQPINLIKSFQFINKATNHSSKPSVDVHSVQSFLRFTQKYWNKEEHQAALQLMNMITTKKIPISTEIETFHEKVKVLLPRRNQKENFDKLMQHIAKEYVFSMGDEGKASAYLFLKKYYPQGAKVWKCERQMNLDLKFSLMYRIFSAVSGRETDLIGEKEYKSNGVKLKYKYYQRYIQDLQGSDASANTRYIERIKQQAQRYVMNQFQGENFSYFRCLLSLYGSHHEVMNHYCYKRFQWLIEQSNSKNDTTITPESDIHYLELPRDPRFIERLCQVLDATYNGQNLSLVSQVFAYNNENLSAQYLSKYFEVKLKQGAYQEIIDVQNAFSLQSGNGILKQRIHQSLSTYMNDALTNQNFSQLHSSSFTELVEKFGSQQNCELNRLIQFRHLLVSHDLTLTKKYLIDCFEIEEGVQNDHSFFTRPKIKALFHRIVCAHLDELKSQKKWSGHSQFIISKYICHDQKDLIFQMRLRWLEHYLNEPSLTETELNAMDMKYQYKNRLVPNAKISLTEFYGEKNLTKVAKILNARLSEIHCGLNTDKLQLISHYAQDLGFKAQVNFQPIVDKLFITRQALKLQFNLNKKYYDKVVQYYQSIQEDIQIQYQACRARNLGQRYPRELNNLVEKVNQYIVESLKEKIFHSYLSHKSKNDLNTFYHEVTQNPEVSFVQQECEKIYAQKNDIFKILDNFNRLFDIKNRTVISIKAKNIVQLKDNLPKTELIKIHGKIKELKSLLSDDDPLLELLSAIEILFIEESGTDLFVRNYTILEHCEDKTLNQRYSLDPIYENLTFKLKNKLDLSVFTWLKASFHSMESVFFESLSLEQKLELSVLLKENIDSTILANRNPFPQQWFYLGKIYDWIHRDMDPALKSNFDSIQTLTEQHLELFKKNLNIIQGTYQQCLLHGENKNIQKVLSKSMIEMQQQCYNSASFVRAFANSALKRELEKISDEVSRFQRLWLMQTIDHSGLLELRLDFCNKLIQAAGCDSQIAQSDRLMKARVEFKTFSSVMHSESVQTLAVKFSIDSYVKSINEALYGYFIDKFHLSKDFIPQILSLVKEWDLETNLLEPKALLKQHPLDEFKKILDKAYDKANASRTRWFYRSKPTDLDVNKLFVAFCISTHALQLANIWQDLQNDPSKAVKHFYPHFISDPLIQLANNLVSEFDVGTHHFNRALTCALAKDKDYFVSWSYPDDLSPKKRIHC